MYDDGFAMSPEDFSKLSKQYDEDGNIKFDIRKNNESNGRIHTDWLNMMYPRLKLAKDLLKDDGVILISIDDNELNNLKKLCDEIFGEINFVTSFVWRKRTGSNDSQNGISVDHEYILIYFKSQKSKFKGTVKTFDNYKNPDNDPRGEWMADNLTCNKTAIQRPNLFYNIIDPETGVEYACNPSRVWAYEKNRMNEAILNGKIIFPKESTGRPMYKRHKSEVKSIYKPFSSIIDTKINSNATKELRDLLEQQVFNYPKGTDLLEQLISQVSNENDIILDFFSGSATTGHAVIKLNTVDSVRRKFIMVQLPEETDVKSEGYKAGYKNICEIGKERIRRAGKKIVEENPDKAKNLDIGFRVLKLDSSNMKDVYYNPSDYSQNMLDMLDDNIKDDRNAEDLLFQVMLELGELLSSDIEELDIKDKKVFNVGDGNIVACFDKDISEEVITEIAKMIPFYAVFRDSSLGGDSIAANFEQIFKTYSPNTIRKVL